MRRGRGSGGGGGGGGGPRGRGRFNGRRDGPMKFEKDFDFESANAQFNKEEIDREFQSKLKIKGTVNMHHYAFCGFKTKYDIILQAFDWIMTL